MGPGMSVFSLIILNEHILGPHNGKRKWCTSSFARGGWIEFKINVSLRKTREEEDLPSRAKKDKNRDTGQAASGRRNIKKWKY